MEKLELKLIVVGIDDSPTAIEALEWAMAEAAATGATVEGIYAWDPRPFIGAGSAPGEWRPLRESAQRHAAHIVRNVAGEDPDVPVIPTMVIGRPAEVLVDASAGADLLVVGSRGLGGLEGIELGSVSHHCAVYAECPVVIVRHDPLNPRRARRGNVDGGARAGAPSDPVGAIATS